MARRQSVEPTDDWQEIKPLCQFREQEEYEEIRPLVLFNASVPERARETGTPERTMYRKKERFGAHGMESLFATDLAAEQAKRQGLEPAIKTMIVELKAEHSAFKNNEIKNIVYARTGRVLGDHTVARVLSEAVVPLKLSRLFEPYHEIENGTEKRNAVLTLHLDGWSAKAIASYMKICRMTVYRVIGRWLAEGEEGLEDKPRGRPKGSGKTTFATMNEVRKLQDNPELGAFRIHAALEQKRGVEVGPRTVGRIMAVHRELYGLGKPKRSPHQKKEMPFEATRRHQIWTADVRYLKTAAPRQLYCISVLENYSRKILASSVSRRQNQTAFLDVLYDAIERYGAPETLLTDGGGIFRADRALAIYGALGIEKVEIEPGQPWQSLIETTFGIQHRMMDFYMEKAQTFEDAVEAHDQWMRDYNAQRHSAHEHREDDRRSPDTVLGFYKKPRYHPDYLHRAFREEPFERVIDSIGYVRIMHWRLLGNEALAKKKVILWISGEELTIEYAGEPLSRYEVEYDPMASTNFVGRLRRVKSPTLFEMSVGLAQLRLFDLDELLGEEGWLKVLKVSEYAPRQPHYPEELQQELFAHDDEEAV